MSKEVQFTEEEMKDLKSIQEKYLEVQNNLGQTQVSLIRLEQQHENLIKYESSLKKEFNETQQTETDFIKKVTDKYGDGELNPNTGKFISKEIEK